VNICACQAIVDYVVHVSAVIHNHRILSRAVANYKNAQRLFVNNDVHKGQWAEDVALVVLHNHSIRYHFVNDVVSFLYVEHYLPKQLNSIEKISMVQAKNIKMRLCKKIIPSSVTP
jgi:hypothetical protein